MRRNAKLAQLAPSEPNEGGGDEGRSGPPTGLGARRRGRADAVSGCSPLVAVARVQVQAGPWRSRG
eukprot:1607497-Pyramimonas_sp.AAC.1